MTIKGFCAGADKMVKLSLGVVASLALMASFWIELANILTVYITYVVSLKIKMKIWNSFWE